MRANSKLKSSEYSVPVLGLIFLRYADHKFTATIQRLGTFLFRLDYAKGGGWGVSDVWHDVKQAFSGKQMGTLYDDLEKVNILRNTRVGQVEAKLDNADEAWEAMVIWFRCLRQMVGLAR